MPLSPVTSSPADAPPTHAEVEAAIASIHNVISTTRLLLSGRDTDLLRAKQPERRPEVRNFQRSSAPPLAVLDTTALLPAAPQAPRLPKAVYLSKPQSPNPDGG
ncbi:MAG: hypothetical protein SP1CHLAM54_00800 [Chlamydiia bacterium]|nr:hypothetical protein [Chlamydiia bacterium]MCH9615002.1 hypothetical protein [Chlamydiia bacterium]MCH9629948.1 hypothetical protein [Chlamydiia bacterium]